MCGWCASPFMKPPRLSHSARVSGVRPSVRIFLLSLVWPQPVALHRLKTGMRISSRIDGQPVMRTSPLWPPLVKM